MTASGGRTKQGTARKDPRQAKATYARVGCVGDTDARVVRVVHVSDTHRQDHLVSIPDGDILVHSGDFLHWASSVNFDVDIDRINAFFAEQPHRHKIFVAGNHELSFEGHSAAEISDRLSSTVIYLQDSSVTLEGLRIYGTPWTGYRYSPATAFTLPFSELNDKVWSSIPSNTQVLITHSPPYDIMDDPCCSIGCEDLRNAVFQRVKPLVHMFGHAHQGAEAQVTEGIVFSNASMSFERCECVVIDICLPNESSNPDKEYCKSLPRSTPNHDSEPSVTAKRRSTCIVS